MTSPDYKDGPSLFVCMFSDGLSVALLTYISHLLTRLAQRRGGAVKARETSATEKRAAKDDGGARRLHPSSDATNGGGNKDERQRPDSILKDQHSCTEAVCWSDQTASPPRRPGRAPVESRLLSQYNTVGPTGISQFHGQTVDEELPCASAVCFQ